MGVAQYLVQHHSKIAAVVLPLSVLGGFATTMMTGKSPFFMFRDAQGEEGAAPLPTSCQQDKALWGLYAMLCISVMHAARQSV